MLTEIGHQQNLQQTLNLNEEDRCLLDLTKIDGKALQIISPQKVTENENGEKEYSTDKTELTTDQTKITRIYTYEAKKYISENRDISNFLKTEFEKYFGTKLNNITSANKIPQNLSDECLNFYNSTKQKLNELNYKKHDLAQIQEDILKITEAKAILVSDGDSNKKEKAKQVIDGYKNAHFLRGIIETFTMQTSNIENEKNGKNYSLPEFNTTSEIAGLLFFILTVNQREFDINKFKSQFIFLDPSKNTEFRSKEVIFDETLETFFKKLKDDTEKEKSKMVKTLPTKTLEDIFDPIKVPALPHIKIPETTNKRSKH